MLSVIDLESGYGRLPVLHKVSLEVRTGEIVGLLGPNGAGKTTLMKTIFGLIPMMSGSVMFDEQDLQDVDPSRLAELGAGLVPQGSNTFPDLSVEDNLRVALPNAKGEAVETRLREMFETFPRLMQRRRQRARTLSGGERQMLALAGAMIGRPRFLALDEPTTGLAPALVSALIQQILAFRTSSSAVLWVIEENPVEALPHVDRVYVLQAGVVEHEMEAQTLLAGDLLQNLFFGAAD